MEIAATERPVEIFKRSPHLKLKEQPLLPIAKDYISPSSVSVDYSVLRARKRGCPLVSHQRMGRHKM
jgi:hypothetical protein